MRTCVQYCTYCAYVLVPLCQIYHKVPKCQIIYKIHNFTISKIIFKLFNYSIQIIHSLSFNFQLNRFNTLYYYILYSTFKSTTSADVQMCRCADWFKTWCSHFETICPSADRVLATVALHRYPFDTAFIWKKAQQLENPKKSQKKQKKNKNKKNTTFSTPSAT